MYSIFQRRRYWRFWEAWEGTLPYRYRTNQRCFYCLYYRNTKLMIIYLFHEINLLIFEDFVIEIRPRSRCLLMWTIFWSKFFLFAESGFTILTVMYLFWEDHVIKVALKQALYVFVSSYEQDKYSFFDDHLFYEEDVLSCSKAQTQHKKKGLYHSFVSFWLLFLLLHPLPGLSLNFQFDQL